MSIELVPEFFAEEIAACREQFTLGQPGVLEIVPDGTVVVGDEWLISAQLERIREVKVTVRDDLAHGDAATVAEEIIRAVLNRERVIPLVQAACYAAYRRLFRGKPKRGGGDIRDQIIEILQLSISSRQADRLVRLLDLPLEIRHAFATKKISRSQAERMLALPPEAQKSIAADCAAGKTWKEIGIEYGVKAPNANSTLQSKLHAVASHLHDLANHLENDEIAIMLAPAAMNRMIDAAHRFTHVLRRLHRRAVSSRRDVLELPANVTIRQSADFDDRQTTMPDRAGD